MVFDLLLFLDAITFFYADVGLPWSWIVLDDTIFIDFLFAKSIYCFSLALDSSFDLWFASYWTLSSLTPMFLPTKVLT